MRASLVFLMAMMVLPGCVRSSAYKHDQNYTQEDDTPSYYSRTNDAAKTPTQKVESMGQPKKRVVIFDFWNDTPVTQNDLGSFAADELKRSLYQTQRVILPTDLKTELVTEDFVHGDTIKVAQLIREGRRLGVSVVIVGRITKIVYRSRGDEIGLLRQKQSLAAVEVEIKIFDVTAGRELAATSKAGEASSSAMLAFDDANVTSAEYRAELARLATRNAIVSLTPEVVRSVEKMVWQGHVAKLVGNKVYISAGKASGLVSGDILKVLTQGEDIYDPTTGAYLGRTQGQLKGTIEVVDFIGTDGAVGELHTGSNFQEGDVVRLY